MREIATIGYEGSDIDALLDALKCAGIQVLIDVRAVPWSRKPGFAKRALAERIEAAGMVYVHLGGLGNPEDGRAAAKAGRTEEYRRIYTDHLAGAAAARDRARAVDLATNEPVYLLCFERRPEACHRSLLADRLAADHGFAIRHLFVGRERRAGQAELPL